MTHDHKDINNKNMFHCQRLKLQMTLIR